MKRLKQLSLSIISITLLAYVGFGLLLFVFQDRFLYYPTPENTDSQYQSFRLQTQDATLKIWKVNSGQEQAIIYFGGNAEDPAKKLDLYKALFPEHTIYAVNYRGYGGSTGSPSQKTLFADALAIYDHIKADHLSISTIGWSLGSGVATYLASERDIDKLVLITPYDSILSVAKQQYPLYPIEHLLRDQYDSAAIAPSIYSKVLILIAEEDQLIPPAHAEQLAKAFTKTQPNVIRIPWVNHYNIGDSQDYLRYLNSFMSLDH